MVWRVAMVQLQREAALKDKQLEQVKKKSKEQVRIHLPYLRIHLPYPSIHRRVVKETKQMHQDLFVFD